MPILSLILNIFFFQFHFLFVDLQNKTKLAIVQFEVKLTGLLLTNGGPLNQTQGDVPYGVLLKPGLSAPIHQHFFCFRMEPCVDGFDNCVSEVNYDSSTSSQNVQGNGLHKTEVIFTREFQAQRNISLEKGRFWKILNRSRFNKMGSPVSFRIVPYDNCISYINPYSPIAKRAKFIEKHLWVTPFSPCEKYPSGDYPNQPNFAYIGLPTYVRNNRPIADTSLSVWYTLGVLHTPRLEEWPIMPVTRTSFSLIPDGFFDENPTIHLQKRHSDPKPGCHVVKSKL